MKKKPPITNRIAALREAKGAMSQAELARVVGVSRQTIVAIEQGHYSPTLERAFLIAQHFGVGIDDVFGWEPGEDT